MRNAKRQWLWVVIGILCLSSFASAQDKTQPSDSPSEKSVIEKFASALIEAKSDEERNELLSDKKELITVELQQILIDKGMQSLQIDDYAQGLIGFRLVLNISEQLGDKNGVARSLIGIGRIHYLQSDIKSALEYFEKGLGIGESIKDKAVMARALNSIGGVYAAQGDYAQALDLYKKSLQLSEESQYKAGIDQALGGIGSIHYLQSNYKEALYYFHKSLALSEELENKTGIASSLNNIGATHVSLGNYDQASEYYQKSLVISEELGDKLAISNLLNNIGVIKQSQGNYAPALELFQKSLAIAEKLQNKALINRALNNVGLVYYSQGKYALALEQYNKSLAVSMEINDKAAIALALNNIGTIHHLQGIYDKALEYYQKSLVIREGLKDRSGIATALSNIGEIYRLQGNYIQALVYCRKSLEIAEESQDKPLMVQILNSFGITEVLLGNYLQALECYERGLKIAEELNDKAGMALTLGNIGYVLFYQGSNKQAIEQYQKSLALSDELKDKRLTAHILGSMGAIYNLQGDNEQALKLVKQAKEIAAQINDSEQIWRFHSTEGLICRALNKPDQARQAFDESIRTIESIRSQLAGGEQAGQFFFEEKIKSYHEMVDLLVSQNNFPEALAYAERAKARVILDVLQSGRVDITKAMSQQEREQEKNLKNQIASLNKKLYAEKQQEKPDEARIAGIEADLNKSRLELEAFQTSLYAAHPELKVKRVDVQPISLDEARDLIPDSRTALLEFVVAERKTHLFVLTRAQQKIDLKIFTIDVNRKDLAERVNSFREMIARKELGFRKPGHELYDLLLKPAEEILKSKTTLIIVPESSLWELPFQVLQTPQNRYLLQDCALFYSPSLTALRETVKLKPSKRTASSPALLAFGNPALKTQNIGSKEPALLDMKLDPLPAAEEQVKALAKLYGLKQSRYYIGAEAREERVKAEAGDYRVLQFATHGILNNASPMYSHLLLSQIEEKSDEDGLLEAREIAEMDLQADMAVLAACETARGRVGAGEGMIGLSWALFVAGCPATVVSQWKVEDEATKELMLEFHRLIKSGARNSRSQLSKAAALRAAALNMMRNGRDAHPFYWAGFVIVGNGR